MAAYSAQQQQQDDELARFQELSNKYEPEATVSDGSFSPHVHRKKRCI
jgi:hypothetical protein